MIIDYLAMALQTPRRKPARTALTALGLAIGVGTFIAMVAFGRGARASVVEQFETLGSNLLRLKTHYGITEAPPHPLTDQDLAALRREATAIEVAVPFVIKQLSVSASGRSVRTSVQGTTPDFVRTRQWQLSAGGLFDASDMSRRSKLCLLGATVAAELFGQRDPLGRTLVLDRKLSCKVIGLLAPRGTSISRSDMDDRVVLPLTTHVAHLGNERGYSVIELRPKSRAELTAAMVETRRIIRRTHGIEPGEVDDFFLISPDQITNVVEQVGGILTALLAGIASVSLLVGGIGIMNIQLVSVAERTHEIGVRAALGAAPDRILGQFLTEAVIISCFGSLCGIALGTTVSLVVARQLGWPEEASVDVALFAGLFGVLIGTLFGYLPAARAARLDPILALHRK